MPATRSADQSNGPTQVQSLTAGEGGIPPIASAILRVVGASEQSEPSTAIARDARIATVPIEQSPAVPAPNLARNPENWPEHVRGMPNFRPVNREQDFVTRPMGANTGEFIFLMLMFSGVRTVGLANQAWRSTVGLVNDQIFRFRVGGEW